MLTAGTSPVPRILCDEHGLADQDLPRMQHTCLTCGRTITFEEIYDLTSRSNRAIPEIVMA
jgi:hypothetical protein